MSIALALDSLHRLYAAARENVRARVTDGGKLAAKKLDQEQLAAHALAYLATEIEAAKQLVAWAETVEKSGEGGSTNGRSPKRTSPS